MNDVNNAGIEALIQGATYHSRNGPVKYVGLDHYHGETTYEFSEPGNPRRRYVLPHQLDTYLVRPVATPSAPVEQREAIATNNRKIAAEFVEQSFQKLFGLTTVRAAVYADVISQLLDNATEYATLAVRLDEAAIRKDEREKQREIDAKIADGMAAEILTRSRALNSGGMIANMLKVNSELVASVASAIRNGGKQP